MADGQPSQNELQLSLVHLPVVKRVTRILVLPEPPNPAHRKHIEGNAETKILTYKKVRNSYSFKAL